MASLYRISLIRPLNDNTVVESLRGEEMEI